MSQQKLQEKISKSLENLRNIDTLKKIFWSQLNYDQVNEKLSRRKLTDKIKDVVEEEPLLLASGGASKAFHVIYTRLKSQDLSRQNERVIVNHLLKEHPYALFVFSNKSRSRWHFLNVKYDDSPQKRKLFRRIAVGEGEKLRTATERISQLDLEQVSSNPDPIYIQTLHDKAFDVEAVTQEFFKEYRKTFSKVEGLIQGIGNDENKRLFTQKLFNRLMFIGFIEKKGWLKFQGKRDYLSALWDDYQSDNNISDKNFYRDRLSHLFFAGLNNRPGQDIIGINNGGFLKDVIGTVPYLNGGLFEPGDDEKPEIIIPDECIDTILHDLFQHFAFTVTESTPLDVDVAVDPEMLGKVFEELVTGRHESGSYYTPKPIVSFMCRESLKGYLKTEVSGESKDASETREAIAQFVDEHNPDNLVNPEAVLEALRKVRCCDIAAGSGAYLLGMLHELLDLRQCLFATKGLDSNTVYQRKLEIIENNLYGIDKDVFAVNIARLRLWLSLAVDYDLKDENDKPKPLPNLKYKIEVGDSLIAPSPTTTGMVRSEFIKEFRQKKAEYMRAHKGEKKRKLEQEINKLKVQIALVTHGSTKVKGFDWAVEFAEVFADGGFDVVVANPPYVRQELIKDLKPNFKKVYPAVYTGTSDLYCFFYARALQLLKTGGMLAFISSNKWFRAKYGEKLRKHIAETCQIHNITDFGELPVFKSAAVLVMIFIAQNLKLPEIPSILTQVKSLDAPYPDVNSIINKCGEVLPHSALKGSTWKLTNAASANFMQKMEEAGIPLSDYVNGQIYYGVKTGFNKAFVIDGTKRAELIAQDPKSSEIIKPLVVGNDIRKWRINSQDKWLIFTRRGIDIDTYPAIKAHLAQWQKELTPKTDNQQSIGRKPGKYKWYEIQDEVAYYSEFEQPKIIYPVIAKESRFVFDTKGDFANDKAFIIPISDYYLLGILNSSFVWKYLKSLCSELLGKSLELRSIYMNKIPIPNASRTDREIISKLVQKCLDAKGVNCEAWEKEIDDHVAALYGL
ncbi:MAG: TaqI-like C-terminal specificity domain-containing protein [Cyanobacteria bacterium J06639_18]